MWSPPAEHPLRPLFAGLTEHAFLTTLGLPGGEHPRHIGDFTLFWTGLYPDAVRRARTGWTRDCFISYCVQGKRSYLIASGFNTGDCKEESGILRRLSDEFELCALG